MDQAVLKEFEDSCTQDSPPACQAACPLHLNVRDFIAHMLAGEWPKARTLLDKALPFAPLLSMLCEHPCEGACARKDLGGSLAIGDLERACISLAPQGKPLKCLPSKNKRLAIIGSGFAALSAAWELALKGYTLTLLHRDASPAGQLEREIAARLGAAWSREQPCLSAYISDAFEQLAAFGLRFEPATEESTAQVLAREGYEASFVDIASFPELAPREEINAVTGSLGEDHLLCYGGFAKQVIMQALEGHRAAVTLQRVLGNSSPFALRENEGPGESRLTVNLRDVEFTPRLSPGKSLFSPEEAKEEASRCLPCQCLICTDYCPYLKHYGEYPKVYARQMFLNMGIYTGYRRLNKQINSCTLCRQCEKLCPERFSMADLCLLMREEMVRQDKMPPSAHYFALQELAAATEPGSVLALGAAPGTACSQVFFPGCQLAALRSAQVRFVFRHLRQNLAPNTGIWLRCCGIPARYAAREDLLQLQIAELTAQWKNLGEPRVVLACASCMAFFKEFLADIPIVSLWEVLDREAPLQGTAGLPQMRGSLHDPCPARDNETWLKAVRGLLGKLEIACDEPGATGPTTACCGYGGLVWSANPAMSDAMAVSRGEELRNDALTSCIMCREQFVSAGKRAWHLFDLLLPAEEHLEQWLELSPPERPVCEAYAGTEQPGKDLPAHKGYGFSRRREQRSLLKTRMERVEYGLVAAEPAPMPFELRMGEELLEKLEAKRILRQDVIETIMAAEKEKSLFYDRAGDRFMARRNTGCVTFWVSYRRVDGARIVLDAYMHRMEIGQQASGAVSQ